MHVFGLNNKKNTNFFIHQMWNDYCLDEKIILYILNKKVHVYIMKIIITITELIVIENNKTKNGNNYQQQTPYIRSKCLDLLG